ncbi:MAG TPA: hypothetical protein VLL25_08415 [Acidimicrobiales bacterium]|nr:hypothetical protein [Acidimicrobiales bacterium]
MQPKMYGTLIAILLGLAFAFGGFGRFAEVVLFGAAGWIIAKVIEGELDPIDYLNSRAPRRRQ